MSSPLNRNHGSGEIREGTRYVLKEITASLNNSPAKQPSRKSANDSASQKTTDHAVKVHFEREFADVKKIPQVTESLSSASSFQSLTSTISSKSSSGICADSILGSPSKFANTSYINSDIPGLDDLIAACADIKISEQGEQADLYSATEDLSQDQTFSSAIGDISLTEENQILGSFKEENFNLNATFGVEIADTITPEDFVSPPEQFPVQDFSSIPPFFSFENSTLKGQDIHTINKDSEIFSTAIEFQKFDGFDQKIVDEDAPSVSQDSSVQSDSTNVETCFNTTIEIQKSISSTNEGASISSEKTESPSISVLLESSNNYPPGEVESVEKPASLKPESDFDQSVSQIIPEESAKAAEKIPEETAKATERIPEEAAEVAERIPEESAKIDKEIPGDSVDSALNSTSPIIPKENQLEDTVILTGNESFFKESSQSSDSDKEKSPFKSQIPQSILDIVAEQQKALDEDTNKSEPVLYRAEEYCKRKVNLSTIVECSPDFRSFNQQNAWNSTIVIPPEETLKATEIILNNEQISITSGQLSDANDTVDSSEIVLKQKTLESTVIKSKDNSKQQLPEIIVHPADLSFEKKTLNNSGTLEGSLNFLEKKEVEPASTAKVLENDFQFELPQSVTPKRPAEKSRINEAAKKIQEDFTIVNRDVNNIVKEIIVQPELDSTVILEGSNLNFEAPGSYGITECTNLSQENYETFKPQQQSTNLALTDPSIFDKVQLEAEAIAKEIFNKSLEILDDNEQYTSATGEIFQDPTSFDFLLTQESTNSRSRDLRFESLYVKFDPLVNNSMLPQGNSQTEDEEQIEKTEISSEPSTDTPKRNPAIALIDKLLFYSPITTGNKTEATKDMKQEASETVPQEIPVVDEKMAKELELVRSLVVQLEEKLQKIEKDREDDTKKYQKDIKKQHDESRKLEEKNSRLEAQLEQEIESKKQVTVVLDEYERSISRLVAERERDRADLEEKTRIKEELQAANQHLSNTEAAFNDVHQKYERLKGVVAAYKSNETVLKESVQENVETIKALENRYEQLKSHAMAQLEKANHELETIRKQNEAETVKLQAMLKKAELKSKSLSDLVEQKTKENKELAQILDEVIARVGNQKAE